MSESKYDFVVCVFCERDLSSDTRVCGFCREYKGIMTVEAWEAYTGERASDHFAVDDEWLGTCNECGTDVQYPDTICHECAEQYYEPAGMSDVEADADTLASAGWGTDEDYGFYGEEY